MDDEPTGSNHHIHATLDYSRLLLLVRMVSFGKHPLERPRRSTYSARVPLMASFPSWLQLALHFWLARPVRLVLLLAEQGSLGPLLVVTFVHALYSCRCHFF